MYCPLFKGMSTISGNYKSPVDRTRPVSIFVQLIARVFSAFRSEITALKLCRTTRTNYSVKTIWFKFRKSTVKIVKVPSTRQRRRPYKRITYSPNRSDGSVHVIIVVRSISRANYSQNSSDNRRQIIFRRTNANSIVTIRNTKND